MKRFDLRRRTDRLDPETQYEEIARILATQEFPWDINQALSFALFRTYAVPTIGRLLFETGEFTERVQKRYDDTGLILDAVLEHGLDQRSRSRRDPPDEPDARLLRHLQRRHAVRAVDVRGDPGALDRRLRLAETHPQRDRRIDQLLPGARQVHGHQARFPRPSRRSRSSSTTTSVNTSSSTRVAAPSPTPRSHSCARSRRTTSRPPP